MGDWSWDETLYAGSAAHYVLGRLSYPSQLGERIAAETGLSGRERALDVGCGPGSLTLLLARYVESIVGVDADAEMIAQAIVGAEREGVGNVSWRRMRGEELPADIGAVDLVTFAQSFHWMDRLRVASVVREMLRPGGSCVHVHATTHRGDSSVHSLPGPPPPYERIDVLVSSYLGPERRAGRSPDSARGRIRPWLLLGARPRYRIRRVAPRPGLALSGVSISLPLGRSESCLRAGADGREGGASYNRRSSANHRGQRPCVADRRRKSTLARHTRQLQAVNGG